MVPSSVRAVCIHGHYYQPPREHPWLGVLEPEGSAAPDRDWNARILRECYAPNASARLLDERGLVRAVADNYEWTSFNVGPTLFAWMATEARSMAAALVRADVRSRARLGYGNAWAQAYNHPILPLCSARDRTTEVQWGVADFVHRFGRVPEGMWLPEMAVDVATLETLATAGVSLTLLSPHQARRVRPLGAADDAWRDVTADTLDVRRLYRVRLPSGAQLDVVFREARLSQGLAFGELLRDGGLLAERMRTALGDAEGLVTLATDGETFGHHHRFGEMAVAYALDALRKVGDVQILNPAAYRAAVPVADEVEIVERSSWSCAHGIERWQADCGCRVGGDAGWVQAWRAPLRQAITWLRDQLDRVFETGVGGVAADPWAVRDQYVDVVVGRRSGDEFVEALGRGGLGSSARVAVRRALEMARHGLLMQTSCGWFFDDVAGLEATLVLRQAARAAELAAALGTDVRNELLDRLALAESNDRQAGTAADVYRRSVLWRPVTMARVAACSTLLDAMGESPSLPGYETTVVRNATAATVTVHELSTGASAQVDTVLLPDGPGGRCRVGDVTYGIADLFLVQRGRVLRRISEDAVEAVRMARHEALTRVERVVDPLLLRSPALPFELAMLLGYEQSDRLVDEVSGGGSLAHLPRRVAMLRTRGVVLPTQAVARALAQRLAGVLRDLPHGASTALEVLDVADAAGITLDLVEEQIALVRWCAERGPVADDSVLAALCGRIGVSDRIGRG